MCESRVHGTWYEKVQCMQNHSLLWSELSNDGLAPPQGVLPRTLAENGHEKAIALIRKALEIETELFGANSIEVIENKGTLARVLDYFNDVDDDEAIRLYEQVISVYSRLDGSSSASVATNKQNLGLVYIHRYNRAFLAHDLDRQLVNMELALPYYHETVRIFRAINYLDEADNNAQSVTRIEEVIRRVRTELAASCQSSNDEQ